MDVLVSSINRGKGQRMVCYILYGRSKTIIETSEAVIKSVAYIENK